MKKFWLPALLIFFALPALAKPRGADLSVTAKSEYRCDVDWQMFPGKINSDTKKNFTNGSILLVEFEKPLSVNGSLIFGMGAQSGSKPSAEMKIGGNVVILKKEEMGAAKKLTYGVLTQEFPLYNVTDLSNAILSLGAKIPKTGFLIFNSDDSHQSVFQRAPIDSDYNRASYLKPLGARCQKTDTKEQIFPFSLE